MSKEISNYQCSGCMIGSSTEEGCYSKKSKEDISCKNHKAGTLTSHQGKIFLGMPKGFNQVGPWPDMTLGFFENKESFLKEWGGYNKLNIPVWKYKNKEGHVFVRGMSPRINMPFLHVFLNDEIFTDLTCQEITDKDLEGMD